MKRSLLSASRLGSLACVLSLHVSNLNAQPLSILAGPITNPANAHIYYLLAPTNWIGAWFNAGRAGGKLVTINDADENAWVFNTFANYDGVPRNLWLGLRDSAQEGTWVWDSGDPSSYRNWAPGEPDNGGAGGNEDYAVMRGPALSSPGTWNDVSGDQTNAPVVEKILPATPATGPFDVAADFSTNQNPNGLWSYGYSTTLGGPMMLHAERGNLTGLDFWRTDISLGIPGVYFNPTNQTVTNATGTVVLGPRQLSFNPGPNGEFCVIRFTAPTKGQYQISGTFTGVDTNGTTTDMHIVVNGGVVINGVVNGFGPGSGPPFDLSASLQAGDHLDFAVGRGSNDFSFDSTGLSATIIRTNPPTGVAPTITSQPESWTVVVGANVFFFVSAAGTAPLAYQWRHEGTNLPGATSTSLILSNVQPADAGTYSVRVSNAVGVATSSNATLTVFTPGPNCAARPAGLVAWWRAEGNVNDSAGTNHGTSLFPSIPYAAGEVGQAFDFGWGPVRVPGSADFLLTNSFAVEGWIYPRQLSDQVIFIVGAGWEILLAVRWPGDVAFEIQNANFQSVSLQTPIQTNQWHHIAATLEGASGTMTLYVDGVTRAQTDTVIRPFGPAGGGPLPGILIGSNDGWAMAPFPGLIDELSLYSRALSSNEVHAIYSAGGAGKCLDGLTPLILSHPTNQTVTAGSNATFTVTATGAPPLIYQWRRYGTNLAGATGTSLTLTNVQPTDAGIYSVLVSNAFGVIISSNATLTVFTPGPNCAARPAGLVAWWRAEGNANDSSGTNHGTTVWPYSSYAAGEVGQAFDFNGNQAVGVQSPDFLLTNSFTVEVWIHCRQLSNQVIFILGEGPGAILLSTTPSPGNVAFGIVNTVYPGDYLWDQSVSLQAPIQIRQWHHIAATFEGTGGTMTLYVDGVARAHTNTVIRPFGGPYAGHPFPLSIGSVVAVCRFNWCPLFPFNGLIDELSLYSRALSSNEVHAIYSADGAGKCPGPSTVDAGRMTSLVCEPGANPRLRFGGTPGNTYTVQASTNLMDWKVVGISMADPNGVCEFEDLNSTELPCRYYRIVVP